MLTLVYGGAAALYLAASLRFLRGFARADPEGSWLGTAIVAAGVIIHFVGVVLYTVGYRELPLVGLGPSLATLSLIIAIALLGLELYSAAQAVGLVLAPAAFLVLVIALAAGIEPAGSETAFRGTWLALHVSLAFMGYAGWVVAASAAFMYLLQFRELKHKRIGSIFRFFPDLETLDQLNRRSLSAGFFALSLGIFIGMAWSVRFEPGGLLTNPKVVWGLISWVLMLAAVTVRVGRRRTSRQAAVWSVTGFGVVLVAYVVVRLLEPGTSLFL